MDNDKNLADQVDELTEHVARLTGLILEMNKLFNTYNSKLERIVQAIEEAERAEYGWDKHDIN